MIEIALGLFLAASIARLFAAFPSAIIGDMMLLVGFQMVRFAKGARLNLDIIPFVATVVVSVITNMVFGYAAGIVANPIFLVVQDI